MGKGQIHAVMASHADSCAVPLTGKHSGVKKLP